MKEKAQVQVEAVRFSCFILSVCPSVMGMQVVLDGLNTRCLGFSYGVEEEHGIRYYAGHWCVFASCTTVVSVQPGRLRQASLFALKTHC